MVNPHSKIRIPKPVRRSLPTPPKRLRRLDGKGGFSVLVRAWRTERKLTRAAAARKLGVPYRTLQDWEASKRTPRGIARRLITAKLTK